MFDNISVYYVAQVRSPGNKYSLLRCVGGVGEAGASVIE